MPLASTLPSLIPFVRQPRPQSGMPAYDEKACLSVGTSCCKYCTRKALSQYECVRVLLNTEAD